MSESLSETPEAWNVMLVMCRKALFPVEKTPAKQTFSLALTGFRRGCMVPKATKLHSKSDIIEINRFAK